MAEQTEQPNKNGLIPLANVRHEKFAIALFKGMSQKEAAIEAGYKESRAYETASRLVRNGKILDRILALQKATESDAVMSVEERKQKLTEIARTTLSDVMELSGDGRDLYFKPEAMKSPAVSYIRTEQIALGKMPVRITRVGLVDKVKPIQELNKMDGQYPAQKFEGKISGNIEITDARQKLLDRVNTLASYRAKTKSGSELN